MPIEIINRSQPKSAWSKKTSIITAIVLLFLSIVIFEIAYISARNQIWLNNYNMPILNWLIDHRKSQVTDILNIVTYIGNPVYLGSIIGGFAIVWAIIKREVWRPALLVGSVSLCPIISDLVKSVVAISRPSQNLMLQPLETGFSLPSAYTLIVLTLALVFGYLIISRHTSDFRITVWLILTIALTTLISFSRIYFGYHWLTDIVASIGIGVGILSIIIIIDRLFIDIFGD